SHRSRYVGPNQYGTEDTRRKQFIGIVAHHLMDALIHLPADRLTHLARAVERGVERRDILMHFNNHDAQAMLREAGADGAVNRTTGDYLYVVDTNLSYNKINDYVHSRVDYVVQVRPNRWLEARLTIRLHNRPSPTLDPGGYGPGGGAYGGRDDYADFLRVFVPAGAQLTGESGWTQPWSPGEAYGKTEFSGYLIVPRGATRVVQLEYTVPPNVFSATHGSHYHLLIQHQPGSYPDGWSVSVMHDGSTAKWHINHPATDWARSLPIERRLFHPLPLVPQSSVVVKPGTWIEPHAYLAAPKPSPN
ncbi:MAG: hypothetical protein ACRDFS_11585, partial [Chloroflexota bacterium]